MLVVAAGPGVAVVVVVVVVGGGGGGGGGGGSRGGRGVVVLVVVAVASVLIAFRSEAGHEHVPAECHHFAVLAVGVVVVTSSLRGDIWDRYLDFTIGDKFSL